MNRGRGSSRAGHQPVQRLQRRVAQRGACNAAASAITVLASSSEQPAS